MLPHALTKRLVNHAPTNDVTKGYAVEWTIALLRGPAQWIADRIEELMNSVPEQFAADDVAIASSTNAAHA